MSAPRNWRKWLVLLLGLALSARPIGCDYSPITEKFGAEAVARCNEKCPFQNRTGDGHFDLSCGSDCSTHQCTIGCSLWKQGLENSCQTSCNVTSETAVSRELYCVMGCNEALNTYFQNLRELIGTPPPPALVADSLTPTSLSLVWEAPNLGNLSCLVQWRYEELAGAWQFYSNGSYATSSVIDVWDLRPYTKYRPVVSIPGAISPNLGNLGCLVQWRYEELAGAWQFYSNGSYATSSIIDVWDLRPYTKYRFRVAIFLTGRGGPGEPIYSAPSVVISTLEHGRPSSPPAALRAAAPDPSRVAISWEPGPFPNGPLIGYVLKLADTQPNAYTALKDMPASNNTFFYMFQNLLPAREYAVSVSMRNAEGEGPTAVVKVSTPQLPASIPQQPVLILGGEQSILAAPANDMLSEPVELYSTQHKITGVGLDISSDYLFVSVSNGYVFRSSLSEKSQSIPILTPETISYKPLDLSVDWLNKHLYVLGEVYYSKSGSVSNTTLFSNWEILRSDFDGKNQLVAVSGFMTRPIHFEIDPYNGYLFFALRGVEPSVGGLYRLDLANISNGVRHKTPPELIVRDAHLGAFTVDHADFRLLVTHLRRNNILAVSLDGREVTDFRSNTQTPMFISTRSIAYANGLFYWTNGNYMLTEEYHAKRDSYFHNEYPLIFNMNKIVPRQVLVNLRSCQPIPVPVNPPIGVQSVMGISKAKVAWSAPHLLGHQGSGAWQQWKFHLHLYCNDTGEVIERKDINGSSYTVENLKENAEYVIKVAAVTESGSGPWSSVFKSKTLESSPTTLQSTLLWAGPDGLLQTDLTGENLQTLLQSSHLEGLQITDISWYRDKLYLVTNASTVIWYNITSHEKGSMANMDNVGSMAVDWVGKRIYWSNPKQQLITRGNLDGGNREPVPIVTVAKELTIDSLGAYIYWNTGHAVEAARLNGENKMVYYPAQLFSGKQVMGLATDLEQKWLYWLVRSYDGSELHRAPTADRFTHGLEVSESLITRLPSTATLGPLCYFSGRLVWVADAARAVVSDLRGRNTAQLLRRVRALALRDPTTHRDSESLIAIPETINSSSIEVRGTWEHFNVSWAAARRVNVNNTKVYYDVSLLVPPNYKIEKTVEVPWLQVHVASVAPYSVMEVSVRAHTHWGGGAAARAQRRTPQAAPSQPHRPRLYVQPATSGGYLTAIFRWEAPVHYNGVIRGYETQCWLLPDGTKPSGTTRPSACADAILPPTHTQLMLRDLVPAATYFFQVRASTDAGYGPYSDIVSASSSDVNPIPKVMTSSQESIKIIDLDSGDSETIPKSTGIPVDLAVSVEENIVYWVNNLEEIFSSRINGSGHYKLTSINGSATSMCFDWVSRSVYWSQLEMASADSYVVYRADVGLANSRPHVTRLFASRQPIYSLQVVPLQRSLYWHEESSNLGLGSLVTSKIDGSELRSFFNSSLRIEKEKSCNCPENPQIARSIVIDLTKEQYEVFWIDPWTNQIIATDMTGCYCRVVVDATEKKKYGFVPMSITIDSKYVYWFNSTERVIYYTTKNAKGRIEQMKASYGYKVLALDPRNQPYPPRQCLFPRTNNLRPKIQSNSANSITLQLPRVNKPEQCLGLEYEMSATEYTVFYRLQTSNDTTACSKESCPFIATTETEVSITDLRPFTNYSVLLEATNYYSKLHEVKPVSGLPLVLQTAAEAPSPAKDVTATVLSPVLARVEWTPEPGLWYELHWRTDNSASPPHKFKEHNTFEVSEGRAANMTRLSPGTLYTVWVRARSNHSAVHADSAALRVKTYPLPNALRTGEVTAYTVSVLWTPPADYHLHQYRVEFASASVPPGPWFPCVQKVRGSWVAGELRPRTRYRFRLRLQYAPHAPPYYWPHDDHFTVETKGDVPGPPGALRVEAVGERVLRAWWAEPEPRGAPARLYRVWGRTQHRNNLHADDVTVKNLSDLYPKDLPTDIDDEFKLRIVREGLELLHNGTESYWLIGEGELLGRYTVWVQAHNAYGWGEISAAAELDVSELTRPAPAHRAAALVAAVAALAALALAVAAPALYMYNNRGKKKAPIDNHLGITPTSRVMDVELATLRQLPSVNRHAQNIIYGGPRAPTDVELSALSHISREQITLNKFLGSGAFGEVFEGVARGLNGASTDTKVAVKTLRKGATDQEKTEFLQEAALMSNFKHEHILRLLGVCLDNDPNYIIMELMEGGDLLSYLRAKRSSLYTPESLTLLDLLNMCVDVTKGCRYLETMHFVHRDLACRNCLVAHRADGRVVKIGDFGLARDIYKNDYYRKEGEGLLPVRWMAVECLVDGVFSCQSDVWAWGVLCWEVLSLGQQPYPARTNREVLAYVRAGGSPQAPPNCPAQLYELLQKCWSYTAESRPSFKQCLEVITELRDKTSPNITLRATSGAPPQYLTLLGDDAVDNRTYLMDENDNAFMDEDFPEHQIEQRLHPERTPKYLELMYDTDSIPGTICDGYETPRMPFGSRGFMPASRHSIVGVAPNRLIKPQLYRTHSLRTNRRPPNATIIPLRNGIVKRASLCESVHGTFEPQASTSVTSALNVDAIKDQVKTPF